MIKNLIIVAITFLSLQGICGNTYTWTDAGGITWSYTVKNGKASVGAYAVNKVNSAKRAVSYLTAGNITIPSTLNGHPVTAIGEYAFWNCTGITCIKIPQGVISIGYAAFKECSNLRDVEIPDSVQIINSAAFEYCSSITNIILPSCLTDAPSNVFSGCTNLSDVKLPSSLTYIGMGMFSGCVGITNITIPKGITKIYNGAFAACSGLEDVVMSEGVTNICIGAFENCTKLSNVTIPSTVTCIGAQVFSGCDSLEKIVFKGNAPTIEDDTFEKKKVVLYVHKGTSGWGSNPDYWRGFRLKVIDPESNLRYQFCGDAPWFAQTNVSVSGIAWQSGITTNRGNSALLGNVIGSGTLSFNWKRQMKSNGKLFFLVDGVQYGDVITENIDWTRVSLEIAGDNLHTFEWKYVAARSGDVTTDVAWVDNIVWQAKDDTIHRVLYDLCDKGSSIGGGDMVQYITQGTAQYFPIVKPNAGWSFEGWSHTNLVTSSITNVAKFTPIEYGVTYDLNAVVCDNSANPRSYTITNEITFVAPTEYDTNRWSFVGWSQDGIPVGDVGDKIITAQWDRAAHSISIAGQSSVTGKYGDMTVLECLATVTNGLTNLVCVGWQGTGCVPPEGTSNRVEVLLSGDGEINWLYQTNVCLVASSDCGQIVPNCQWYNLADNVIEEVNFVPNVGYQLYAWTLDGEIQEPIAGNLPLSLTMDGARQVGVVTRRTVVVNTNAVGSASAWKLVKSQTYRSGEIVNNQRSDMSIKIVGPATCSFDWAVSSENGYDYLYCYIDDEPSIAKITGAQNWATVNVDVGDGSHTVMWSFKKDDMDEDPVGDDCGWVRNITITGDDYQYAVKFNAGDHGAIPAAEALQFVDWGGSPSVPTVKVEDGWSFSGWNGMASNITANTELAATYVCNGFPDIGDSPSESQVKEALAGSCDPQIVEQINQDNYSDFKEWSKNVKRSDGSGVAGAQAIKLSPNSWLSFAFDCDKLISKALTNGQMRVEKFEPTSTAGSFDFTIAIDDIAVGSEATKENLKKVFGLEGGATLDTMSSTNVDISFGTPENGRVKFTAGPNAKNADAKTFFMKVKMTP